MNYRLKIFLIFFFSWFISLSLINLLYFKHIINLELTFKGIGYYLKIILFIICQTLTEEFIFRFLLYYIFYFIFNNLLKISIDKRIFISVISLISGFVFILPHLRNPEVLSSSNKWIYIVSYFIVGFYFMYIMIVTKTIISPFACHFSNNAFHMMLIAPYNQSEYFKTPFLNLITENNIFYSFLNIFLPIVLSYFMYLVVLKQTRYTLKNK